MHGHHHGMYRRRPMGRPLITMMLRHRDELGLSPAQVQSLEKLRGDYMREAIRRDADRKIARLDLMTLMRPDPNDPLKAVDMAQVEGKLRELEKMRTDMALARIRTIEAGKAQLTPDQRTKFAGLLAQMRSRWQRGGPPQRPMGPQGPMAPTPPRS
jgi:Spy/CpxP family protein refolding chaperone